MATNTSWSGQRHSFPTSVRRACLARDPICRTCHQAPSTIADHVIPVAEGGADTLDNAAGICPPCHAIKTRAEQQRGRQRAPTARRPPEQHPGLH